MAKFGEIIPAPLHWAVRRTVPEGSRTSRLARFSNASVVWIAFWKSMSPSRRSCPLAARIPCSTASTGKYQLMPPVEPSSNSLRLHAHGERSGALRLGGVVQAASAGSGVGAAGVGEHRAQRIQAAALATEQHGAAAVPLAVKRAALTGRSVSQISRPRSWLPLGLIPQTTPAARKPAGSPVSGSSSRTCAGTATQREPKNGRGGPSLERSPHTSLPALIPATPYRNACTQPSS